MPLFVQTGFDSHTENPVEKLAKVKGDNDPCFGKEVGHLTVFLTKSTARLVKVSTSQIIPFEIFRHDWAKEHPGSRWDFSFPRA